MSANVESMFYVRKAPWHGLGVRVLSAPDSREALHVAGLDWKVIQEPIFTEKDEEIVGYKANVRDKDRKVQIASQNGHLCHIRRPLCDLNGGQPGTH